MKAICIDDEQLALEYLKRQINKLKSINVIGMYMDPIEGLKRIIAEEVDIVFLDIHLPGMNGIELAEKVLQDKPDVTIVFVTAFDKYAVQAFELNAIDYLVKPVTYERLQKTVNRIKMQLNVEDTIDTNTNLQVKVSNYLQFKIEPDAFQPIQWRTAKTQELFLYLLQNNGQLVEKSTLMELLWGVYELDKGYSLLYTTIYNVRKALRPFNDYFIIHSRSDSYLLELKNVTIDLYEWEKKLVNLPRLTSGTIKNYEMVMEQNEEQYLSSHDYIWLEAERQRIENLWQTNAIDIATYYETNEKIDDAITWYKRICERTVENEEAHFSLMKIYEQTGEYDLVVKQYRKLISVLREELSVEPSIYIQKWYEKQIIQKVKRQNINYPS